VSRFRHKWRSHTHINLTEFDFMYNSTQPRNTANLSGRFKPKSFFISDTERNRAIKHTGCIDKTDLFKVSCQWRRHCCTEVSVVLTTKQNSYKTHKHNMFHSRSDRLDCPDCPNSPTKFDQLLIGVSDCYSTMHGPNTTSHDFNPTTNPISTRSSQPLHDLYLANSTLTRSLLDFRVWYKKKT